MTKHLRLIINLLIICFLLSALALIIPPSAGVTTVIIDHNITDTNLGIGTVVYSHPVNTNRLDEGDQLLDFSDTSVHVSKFTGKENSFKARETAEKVYITVPLIGYISIAAHSFEGRIILCLLFSALVVLYILSGILKNDEEDDMKKIRAQNLLEFASSKSFKNADSDTSEFLESTEHKDQRPASDSSEIISDDETLANTIQEALEKEIDRNFYIKNEDTMPEDINMSKAKSVTIPENMEIPSLNYGDIMEKPNVNNTSGIGSRPKETISCREKTVALAREKDLLCRQAAQLVEDGDIIYIDSGTTCRNMIDYISDKNVTIITNSLRVTARATEYSNLNVISLPGKLKTDTLSLVGTDCLEYFKRYNIGKAFLSCSGISVKNGLTIASAEEYIIKKAVIENSQENYLLADHPKFGKVSLMTYAKLDQIQSVITDHILPKEYQEQCDINNIDLLIS